MMTEEQRIERLEAYLGGTMSKDERVIFDSELALDQSLREELEKHKKAHQAITYMNRKELKQKLETIDAESVFPAKQARIRKLVLRVAAAASIVLLVGFGIVFTTGYFEQESSLADLSEEYFVPTIPESFRGENDQNTSSFEEQLVQADLLYQNGDYAGAIVEYKRLSLIDHTLNDLADWNLLMSYLLSESHQSEFKNLLNRIVADQRHMYQERARRLQKEL